MAGRARAAGNGEKILLVDGEEPLMRLPLDQARKEIGLLPKLSAA